MKEESTTRKTFAFQEKKKNHKSWGLSTSSSSSRERERERDLENNKSDREGHDDHSSS
ncbi:hypothetical protein HYC85_020735 [Camellia sinensis]|uniref:Uncharacterized protein n=1 Tax=Camellia sinensis TaxID=4442 RepID=A0A7J7GQN0_CAMSI|nr:hypothetical protein HYC85_020735 [Camellia sinensis]